ncbi:MAG: PLP-dependent aminotransferase family protein [Burkholderiales bacterium]|nr:PLP-dependent aminotransferase family protein [Burkholderiales bacterium]
MTDLIRRWARDLRDSDKPAYRAIADLIAADIQGGRLAALQRLPPLRELAQSLALNYTTVARGYAEAQRRGLVDAKAGMGTFIRAAAPPPVSRSGIAGSLAEMTMNLPPEPRDVDLLERMREGLVHLHVGMDPYALLRYQEFGGAVADREAGSRWLAARLPGLTADRVLVCPGVQSVLLALLSTLARPGDVVCCEALTYPGTKGIATQLGIRLEPLAVDADGIDPDAFETACREHAPKALYLNPTLLNPTTATLSRLRRDAVVAIARRHNVPIVEDDAYGLLPTQSPPPLASLAPELTFYVTGMAKHVGAGLRIAYLVSPDARQSIRLAATLRTMTVMASPLSLALATRWIEDGTADTALDAIRHESVSRQRLAARLLPADAVQTHPEAFHLWLSLPAPWHRLEFSSHLRGLGVGVVGSDAFAAGPVVPEAVRVCLGGVADFDGCRRALELIADTLAHEPAVVSTAM